MGKATIQKAAAEFAATFNLRGFPGDNFRIAESKSFVSAGVVQLVVQRNVDGRWLDFSRGTIAELKRQVS